MSSSAAFKAARSNFTNFKVLVNPQYKRARHLDLLDRALSEVARYLETGKGIQRLIIMMPPRHGKSLTVSQMFPAWLFGRNPGKRIILASYSSLLAETHSRIARNYIETSAYAEIFPNTSISGDNARVEEWEVHGARGEVGGMIAVGIGGSVTGKGADLLIIDDPHKNRAEVESATIRESTYAAYVNDLVTRFNDGSRAAQIVMATRWHHDDLTGRLLSAQGKRWTVISLPAIATEHDILGRAEGEALWPQKWDTESLEQLRSDIGDYAFSSLYQQTPIPRGEAVFNTDRLKIVSVPPKLKGIVVRYYDLAVTIKKQNDYTVGLKLGITENEELVILDVFRVKLKAPDLLRETIANAKKDGKACHVALEGEKAGIVHLDYLLESPELRGYTMKLFPVVGDKLARAQAVINRVENNRVMLVKGAWNRAFIDELSVFPSGAHDDQVDAFSGAYDYLCNQVLPVITPTTIGQEYNTNSGARFTLDFS